MACGMIQAADSVVIPSRWETSSPTEFPVAAIYDGMGVLLSRSMDLGLHRAKCHGSLKYGARICPSETKSEPPVNSEKNDIRYIGIIKHKEKTSPNNSPEQ